MPGPIWWQNHFLLLMIFQLFPQARLLILVRDGRSVVESTVKSFGTSYELSMQRWAEAARIILEFQKNNQNKSGNFLIVRYEDLLDNLEKELIRILKRSLRLLAKTWVYSTLVDFDF